MYLFSPSSTCIARLDSLVLKVERHKKNCISDICRNCKSSISLSVKYVVFVRYPDGVITVGQ